MTLRRFRSDLSIRAKLLLLVIFAASAASIVSAGLSVYREMSGFADVKRREVGALAAVFASMTAEAAVKGDADAADPVLRAIGAMPHVRSVMLVDMAGKVIAEQGLGVRLESDASTLAGDAWGTTLGILRSGTLQVAAPIRRGGETVGRIDLLVETPELSERVKDLVQNALLATCLAVLIGFASAHQLRRGISTRIAAIAGAMRNIRTSHDYALTIRDNRRDELGELAGGFNEMMREIRERDARLANYRGDLEREVSERTADLVVAKQRADEANAAKSDFLATMSHEIRTPMNGMLVMAELLAASELSPRQRRYADVIVSSGGSLMSIINDVLDFSKIEAGKIELEAIPFDLAETVDNVAQLFASKAEGKGLDLASYVAPELSTLIGDPTRMGQVVGNLVNNAIKFTESGHVMISARVARDAEAPRLLIEVSDTGIGIPEDKLATVFESFSQADQTTTRKFGGTGLGLSICQRLVVAMGGEIGVRSVVGEGSTFWISVPLVTAETISVASRAGCNVEIGMGAAATARALALYFPETPAGAAPAGRKIWIVDERGYDCLARLGFRAQAPRPAISIVSRIGQSRAEQLVKEGAVDALLSWPLRRAELTAVVEALAEGRQVELLAKAAASALPQFPRSRVLVVDDSPVNREVALEALKRFGVEADTAEGGVQALAMTAASSYDLVLMDGSMPDIDGFETARRIRAREAESGEPRTTIFALTAHVVGEAATAWKAAGMDGILPKPFRMEAMAACLAGSLSGEPAAEMKAPSLSAPATPLPAGEPDPGSLFDPDTLARMAAMAAMAGTDAARRIYGLFAEHASPGLEQLRDAVVGGEAARVASAAHAIKSMSLSIGASALAGALAEVEFEARERGVIPSQGMLQGIEALLRDTLSAINGLPFLRDTQAAAGAMRDQKTA